MSLGSSAADARRSIDKFREKRDAHSEASTPSDTASSGYFGLLGKKLLFGNLSSQPSRTLRRSQNSFSISHISV
jgi:hypothetical protein